MAPTKVTDATAVALRPLAPGVGMEVLGVDLREPLTDAAFATIERALADHCVILLRGQDLTEDHHVAFASRFGPLAQVLHKHNGRSQHHPGVMFISNIRENGELIGALPDGEMMFHSDQCYIERPCMASMLYAIEIPSVGGNTLFANMYAAYDALSDDVKSRLAGAKAMNVYDYGGSPTHRGATAENAPRHAHPVFRTHPVTGRKALYVNRLMTQYIEGMERAESDHILEQLFEHMENEAWIYEHRWQVGDLVVWDNRCAAHARTDFSAAERRLMRRSVVLGEKPY